VQVLDVDPRARPPRAVARPPWCGRVGDEEDVVLGTDVLDEVVDDLPDSAHIVYCALPGLILRRSLVRQALTKSTAPSDHRRLAQVADVEDPDPLAHRGVLRDDPAAGVLDGHVPAPEVRHLRPEGDVTLVQWRGLEVRHAAEASRVPAE
jgi:hypothetical protein